MPILFLLSPLTRLKTMQGSILMRLLVFMGFFCPLFWIGTQFPYHFWKAFQKPLGTQVKLSTTFHPQTYSQAKRTIETVEEMLRSCAIHFKGNCADNVPLIEFSYNNSYHSSISMDSFESLYRRR